MAIRRTVPAPALDPEFRSPSPAQLLERVAWLMDRAVTIPGTRVTVGLDVLLCLFPGLGDVLAGAIQPSGNRTTEP